MPQAPTFPVADISSNALVVLGKAHPDFFLEGAHEFDTVVVSDAAQLLSAEGERAFADDFEAFSERAVAYCGQSALFELCAYKFEGLDFVILRERHLNEYEPFIDRVFQMPTEEFECDWSHIYADWDSALADYLSKVTAAMSESYTTSETWKA